MTPFLQAISQMRDDWAQQRLTDALTNCLSVEELLRQIEYLRSASLKRQWFQYLSTLEDLTEEEATLVLRGARALGGATARLEVILNLIGSAPPDELLAAARELPDRQLETALLRIIRPVAHDMNLLVHEEIPSRFELSAEPFAGEPLVYDVDRTDLLGEVDQDGSTIIYTSPADHNDLDRFTFRVRNDKLSSNVAEVSIFVQPVNDEPQAESQGPIEIAEDTAPTELPTIILTATDADEEHDADSLEYLIVTRPRHGELDQDGRRVVYTPKKNYSGEDDFTFRAGDGQALSKVARVSISVTPVNDEPEVTDRAFRLPHGTTLAIEPPATDDDGPSPLVYEITLPAQHGVASVAGGYLMYVPKAGPPGPVFFEFSASDGVAPPQTGRISIEVLPPVEPPAAQAPAVEQP